MYEDVIYVSKITKTKNKKIRILLTVALGNLIAGVDIAIIILFSSIITGDVQEDNILFSFVNLFLESKFLIPVLVVIRFILVYVNSINMKLLEIEINRNLKVRLLEEVFTKSNYSISDAYFYINELTGHITFFYQHLTGFLASFIQIIVYGYYLTVSDASTLVYFLGGMLILYYPLRAIIKKSRKLTDTVYWISLNISEEIAKIVENMYLIKILKKDTEEIDNFHRALKERDDYGIRKVIWDSASGYLPTFLTMFVLGILVSFSNIVKNLTFDFIGVTLRLFQQLGTVSGAVNNLLNSQIHIKHFTNIDRNRIGMSKEHYKIDNSTTPTLSVSLNNLTFQYFNSDTPIFKNISITFPLNEHTLITGPNGSGKSTLLGLISGVLIPNEGNINISSEKLGYIGAIPFIFKDTMRNNLMYGNDLSIDDEELIKKMRDFDIFKEEQNYDLNKMVSNKSLSSGQMQKVAFIRALMSNPDILLLDESTANLDDDSRDLIFSILEKKNMTIINSTHDPSSFNAKNRLIVSLDEQERFLSYEK